MAPTLVNLRIQPVCGNSRCDQREQCYHERLRTTAREVFSTVTAVAAADNAVPPTTMTSNEIQWASNEGDRAKAGALCRNMVSLIVGRECRIPLLEA